MANKEIGRIPTMDGLRAVSVLFVIVSHSHIGANGFFSLGNIGVQMFFCVFQLFSVPPFRRVAELESSPLRLSSGK